MVAVLIYEIFGLGIIALLLLDLYLGGVFLHHVINTYRPGGVKDCVGKAEGDALGAVVNGELTAKE